MVCVEPLNIRGESSRAAEVSVLLLKLSVAEGGQTAAWLQLVTKSPIKRHTIQVAT